MKNIEMKNIQMNNSKIYGVGEKCLMYFSFFIFFIILSTSVVAETSVETIVLSTDTAYSFEINNFTNEEKADISYAGKWDKELEYEHPSLYTDNDPGRVERTQAECNGQLSLEKQESHAIVGSTYCLKSQSGNLYVQFIVEEIHDSWDNVTLTILKKFTAPEKLDSNQSNLSGVSGASSETILSSSQDIEIEEIDKSRSLWPFFIGLNIILLILIIIVWRKIG